jgi:tRNA pseudouridine55 synthase
MPQTQSVLNLYKEVGETPLLCLERYRAEHPEYKDLPMTYAGRLDPMAEGVLLVLAGEECKKKDEYLGLDKEYEVEILFGFDTDTYDILGKIEKVGEAHNISKDLFSILQSFVGKFIQEYPKYSSKFLSQNADPEETHTKEVEIYSVDYLGMWDVSASDLLIDIESRIAKVKGDFRQQEIINLWKENLSGKNQEYQIIKIKVSCGSGTYMRSLAHNLGQKLAVPALAFSIKRERIGQYCNGSVFVL